MTLFTTPQRRWPVLTSLAVLFALAVAATFGWHWYVDTYRPAREAREVAAGALDLVRRSMKDPASAQFRNVLVHGKLVCGEVNARNTFGGYAGFSPFLVDLGSSVPVSLDSAPAVELCRGLAKRSDSVLVDFKSSG